MDRNHRTLYRPTAPDDRVELGPADVHLWYARTDRISPVRYEMLRDVLAPEERRRADDYFQEKDRRTSTVARGLLRLQLAQYTGLPPAAIRFDSMGNGKPVLAASTGAGGAPPVYFNVSHRGKGVLLGFLCCC